MKQRLERVFDWLDRRRGRAHADAVASPYRAGVRSVTQAPLPRASRWMLLALMGLLVAVLAWATFGRIDVTAMAPGRTVVSSRVKPVQASIRGRVKKVLVSQGDHVEAGEPLILLEDAAAAAEVRELEGKLARARAARARLKGLLAADAATEFRSDEPVVAPRFRLDATVPAATARRARALMHSQWRAYRDRIEKLMLQRAKRLAQRETARASLHLIQAQLPFIENKVGRLRKLTKSGSISLQKLDNARRKLVKWRHKLQVQKRRLAEANAKLRLMEQRIAAARSEFRVKHSRQLSDVRSRIATLKQKLVKAKESLAQRVIRSPIDGVVQDIKIHSQGAVVRPARTLMRVVPEDQPVEVRAWIRNRDIGFVHVGQSVDVRFRAFNFTRYGEVPGVIREIASTSTMHKKLGRVYSALIELKRPYIEVQGERVQLRPGLTATVSIDLGSRRIIQYFLEPLLRYGATALNER